mmetsp:Transcript_123672/g.385086  ORF Transcript_123672/g.385086 Transcript_123672/m.385086 type:complete len:325 (-) Transcript_123672:37-1011(-)
MLHHGACQGQPHAPPLHGRNGPPDSAGKTRPHIPGAHASCTAKGAVGHQPAAGLDQGHRRPALLQEAEGRGHADPAPLARRAAAPPAPGHVAHAQVAPPPGQQLLLADDRGREGCGEAEGLCHARSEGRDAARGERLAARAQGHDHRHGRRGPPGGRGQDSADIGRRRGFSSNTCNDPDSNGFVGPNDWCIDGSVPDEAGEPQPLHYVRPEPLPEQLRRRHLRPSGRRPQGGGPVPEGRARPAQHDAAADHPLGRQAHVGALEGGGRGARAARAGGARAARGRPLEFVPRVLAHGELAMHLSTASMRLGGACEFRSARATLARR